ncbi:MAG: MliC family protein [Roseobacter sp.]
MRYQAPNGGRQAALVFAAALLGTSAPASASPSFDCAKAESSAEELICADDALAQLDQRLTDRFQAALNAIRSMDVGAQAAEDDLRATQRGWIKGRDECWKADDLRACVEDSYLIRETELVAFWILETPRNTAYWTCSSAADEIVTMFFDTERPALRFEIGDRISTASLVRSASGSRYSGNFGEEIWIKGDEALYRAPDPAGTEKTCSLRAQEAPTSD